MDFLKNFRRFILLKLKGSKRLFNVRSVFSLSNSKELVAIINKYSRLILRLSTGNRRISPRLRMFNNLLRLILKTFHNHGATYTVKWLKACHLAVQQKISGKTVRSLRLFEPDLPLPRLINGLPAFMPKYERRLICGGDHKTIRMWLSIFSIYRVLDAPGKVKLETITEVFSGSLETISSISDIFSEQLLFLKSSKGLNPFKGLSIYSLSARSLLKLQSSGPNHPIAFHSVLGDAIGLGRYRNVLHSYMAYAKATRSTLNPSLYFDLAFNLWRNPEYKFPISFKTVSEEEALTMIREGTKVDRFNRVPYTYSDYTPAKLAFLPEAAGKVRVIAIVDIWTQSLLKPLHDTLFSVLKVIPNDGTFDQDSSFARVMEKASTFGRAYSVDLSAATDRLPVLLQENILNILFGKSVGTHWKDLLIKRPYHIKDNNHFVDKTKIPYVHYGTGQPMGCLSSWAMLAITHHIILQACAFRVYGTRTWFEDYEILGDDLVIFDTLIYEEYLKIMADLKVQTNPSKSMISHNLDVAEFAKRTCYKGKDVSGLSWKQFISEDSFRGKINTLISLGRKGLLDSPSSIIDLLMNERFRNLNPFELSSNRKFKVDTSLSSVLSYFISCKLITYELALASFVNPSDKEGSNVLSGSLPTKMMLLNLVRAFNLKGLPLEFARIEDSPFFLSDKDKRLEISSNYVLPYIGNSVVRIINQRLESLSNLVVSKVDEERVLRLNDEIIVKEAMKINPKYGSDINLAVFNAASSVMFWTNQFGKLAKLRFESERILSGPLTIQEALDLLERIEIFSMDLESSGKTDGLNTKAIVPPFLQRDLLRSVEVPKGTKVIKHSHSGKDPVMQNANLPNDLNPYIFNPDGTFTEGFKSSWSYKVLNWFHLL